MLLDIADINLFFSKISFRFYGKKMNSTLGHTD